MKFGVAHALGRFAAQKGKVVLRDGFGSLAGWGCCGIFLTCRYLN